MKDSMQVSNQAKDDVQAIKDDMKDIMKRVGDLKGESLNMLYEGSEELMNNMRNLKDKIVDQGVKGTGALCNCIEKNPLKSALYCFGAGIVLTMLLRK